jgi:TRAP-type C4-dicarboxylate transport system substrate-binding protein
MRTRDRRRWVLRAALACAAAGVVPACTGGSHNANKAGASVEHKVALRLEMPDSGDPRGTLFAQAVDRRSHGSVRVRIDMTGYSNLNPGNELALARALEGGHEDIAYLPARAWAAARLPAFRALLAPFVITTEHASQNVANAPVAQRILATLPKSVVGIALVPDQARRVLADRPVASLAAFSGMRIRIVANPQSAADFAALGAALVPGLDFKQALRAIEADEVDAVEASTHTILINTYFARIRHLSAYSIFPKFQSIVVSRRTWARLSPTQRQAIRAAAADTIAASERQIAVQDQQELTSLCQAKVALSFASASDLSALVAAVQPVVTSLEQDATAASVLAALRRVPGAGPRPLATPLPAACRPGATNTGSPAKGSATIPNGVYEVTDSLEDLQAAGLKGRDFSAAITVVTTMRNGRWYQTQSPSYPCSGLWSGTYSIREDEIVFTYLKVGAHGECAIEAPDTLRWSYFGGLLRFSVVNVVDPAAKVLYTAHPWRKIR